MKSPEEIFFKKKKKKKRENQGSPVEIIDWGSGCMVHTICSDEFEEENGDESQKEYGNDQHLSASS